jgi:hypothetical protein
MANVRAALWDVPANELARGGAVRPARPDPSRVQGASPLRPGHGQLTGDSDIVAKILKPNGTPSRPEAPGDRPQTRRSILKRTAAAAAVAPALALANRPAQAAHPAGLTSILFHEILNDEASHVTILQTLLNDPDNPLNPKIRPMPTLRNLVQPNLKAFIESAAAFENTGSGTYGGALFAVQQTMEYFPIAVGLTTVEARHASWLNSLLGEALVPNFVPVESPIPQNVTLSRVAPFIASLNAPAPSFDPLNASDANNFAILDFLLLLEYIEAAFYKVNVPRFFH